jgi:hypothetical protein
MRKREEMKKELRQHVKIFLVLLLILSMFAFVGCADTNDNGIPDEPGDVVPDVTDNDEIDNNNDGNNGIGTDENGADGMGNGAGNGDNDLNQNLTDGGIDN